MSSNCNNCNSSSNVPPDSPEPIDSCNGNYTSSDCVRYGGIPLSNILVSTGDSLTQILISINDIINNIIVGSCSFTVTPGTGITINGDTLPVLINCGDDFSIESTMSVTSDNGLTNNTITNVQLGGTLIHNTSIDTKNFDFIFTNNTNTKATLQLFQQSVVNSNQAPALYSQAYNGLAGEFWGGYLQTNNSSIQPIIKVGRTTSNPLVGTYDEIGGSIDFTNPTVPSFLAPAIIYSNRLASRWQNSNQSTPLSRFEIWGVNVSRQRNLALIGTGELILDQYGIGTFLNTPVYFLGVDATGNVLEVDLSLANVLISADNGLTADTPRNVQLGSTTNTGSPLLHTSYINTTPAFQLIVNGNVPNSTANGTLYVINNSTASVLDKTIYATALQGRAVHGDATTGVGIFGNSNSGIGVFGQSGTGIGGYFQASTGQGLYAQNTSDTNSVFLTHQFPSSTNTVITTVEFWRGSSGTPANGLGQNIDLTLAPASSGSTSLVSNRLVTKWSDATLATATSQFEIWGRKTGTLQALLTINGEGSFKLINLTATLASAITPSNGMLIYVSTTDATFTSVGFWGYEAGAWVKL